MIYGSETWASETLLFIIVMEAVTQCKRGSTMGDAIC